MDHEQRFDARAHRRLRLIRQLVLHATVHMQRYRVVFGGGGGGAVGRGFCGR